MPNSKRSRIPCLYCGKKGERWNHKYCSNACQREHAFKIYIRKWRAGREIGLTSLGLVSSYIKRYLRRKFNDQCCLCGWSQVNPITGKVPLVADHIDGNWRNNAESNLRLMCPNCDSLTLTYAALNRGNGRKNRVISKRTKEGRLLKLGGK